MPTGEGLAVRLLGAERGAPAEDVRADQVLGRVEHTRFADHLVDPGADHVCLLVELDAVVRVAGLEGFKLVPIVERALFGDRTDGRDETVTFECVYLTGREHLWHGEPHVFLVLLGRVKSRRVGTLFFHSGRRSIGRAGAEEKRRTAGFGVAGFPAMMRADVTFGSDEHERRDRHPRRRVLLVPGGRLQGPARRTERDVRLCRRACRQPELQAGVLGEYRACRGGADPLRSGGGVVRGPAARVLHHP